jgi:predicted enzyme related to lactoylglutathione lyase
MERVRGIGGIFFRCRSDRQALLDWYKSTLGIDVSSWGGAVFADATVATEGLTWSVFARDTDYFGPDGAPFMINYKVDDLDAMLVQLREAGAEVADDVEESEYGRFAWAVDPEGHRFELWQPPEGGPPLQ